MITEKDQNELPSLAVNTSENALNDSTTIEEETLTLAKPENKVRENVSLAPDMISVKEQDLFPPFITKPLMPTISKGKREKVQMLTIILRATGDRPRDVLRLRRIYGITTSFPGNDRFACYIFEKKRSYLMEFPNITIGICQELISRLDPLVGADNIRVEEITIQ